MRISYSALDTYKSCPLKYKYQQIDKIKTPKSKEAVFGTILHSTLKFIHTPGILSPTLEQAMEFFSNSWNPAVFDSPEEERAAFVQGVKIIQDYFRQNNPADFNIVNLESRFQIEIGEAENKHIISGIIDRIDRTADGFEIIDYKTTKKMPTQDRVEGDMQLSVYLAAFLSYYPDERKNLDKLKVSLYFLKHGVKLSATRTEEQLKENEAVFLETIKLIEEGKFEPTISPLCDWCGYQNICPMWKHKFKEARKIDTEEIAGLIDEYIDLKSAMALTKDRLMKIQEDIVTYMGQEGVERVFGSQGIIARSLRVTYKYDEDKIQAILEPLGRWQEVLKLDKTALKNISDLLPAPVKKEIEKAKIEDKTTSSLIVKKGSQ
ncbi:MAG: PD-(D/E)XK nuclease family protein [Candidatus Moranbacteria bacterium]|nr:PD-(D/E)XK nuclease family protein [Candidatus Moranbacteria bacterium]